MRANEGVDTEAGHEEDEYGGKQQVEEALDVSFEAADALHSARHRPEGDDQKEEADHLIPEDAERTNHSGHNVLDKLTAVGLRYLHGRTFPIVANRVNAAKKGIGGT